MMSAIECYDADPCHLPDGARIATNSGSVMLDLIVVYKIKMSILDINKLRSDGLSHRGGLVSKQDGGITRGDIQIAGVLWLGRRPKTGPAPRVWL